MQNFLENRIIVTHIIFAPEGLSPLGLPRWPAIAAHLSVPTQSLAGAFLYHLGPPLPPVLPCDVYSQQLSVLKSPLSAPCMTQGSGVSLMRTLDLSALQTSTVHPAGLPAVWECSLCLRCGQEPHGPPASVKCDSRN